MEAVRELKQQVMERSEQRDAGLQENVAASEESAEWCKEWKTRCQRLGMKELAQLAEHQLDAWAHTPPQRMARGHSRAAPQVVL